MQEDEEYGVLRFCHLLCRKCDCITSPLHHAPLPEFRIRFGESRKQSKALK